ncbi:MAG TPA: DUF6600 domain-containing protein [Verrucomicrobiae bacterium]|nr:DUF6600 domain-containing protein [Verrucomicrobiae bacterium]
MKIARPLVLRLLLILLFAVTTLAVSAAAQDQGAPPPSQRDPNQATPPPPTADQANAPAMDVDAEVDATQSQGESQGQNTPATAPGSQPTVGRLSLIHGDVSTQRGDSGDWSAVTLNTPLVRGDQVATGEKSNAEIQLDHANILRLSSRAQVKIADLTRSNIQLQVSQGFTSLTVLKANEANTEIDTPNVTVHPLRPGRYRVQVNSDTETEVIVREGEAEVTTPQGSTTVKEGELITIRGSSNPEYKVSSAPGKDDFDSWSKDRDRLIQDAEGGRKTNSYYTGAQDLDAYGRWVNAPGYGSVWQPYADAGWAPYQSGRWVWEPYYGWTWVSYEPWGWAPYHYGRWFYYGSSWSWWPGPVYPAYRPLWAPAFVFFFGFGHHSGFGFGSIGWLPVGPCDRFYPWYGRGFRNVTVVNINVIHEHHGGFVRPLGVSGRQPFGSNLSLASTNAHVRGGITTVGAGEFGRGTISARNRGGVDAATFRQGQVMTGNLGVVPTRESLRTTASGSGRVGSTIQPRAADHFFTRNQPPAGPPAFHQQAAQVQQVVQSRSSGPASGGVQSSTRVGAATTTQTGGGRMTDAGANQGGHSISPQQGNTAQAGAGVKSAGAASPRNMGGVTSNPSGNVAGKMSSSGPANTTANGSERTGWHTFGAGGGSPSTGNVMRQSGGMDHASGGGGRPPLELSKPIVTPRNSGSTMTRSPSPSYSGGPSYSPAPSRNSSPSYSGGPRYSPPPTRGSSPGYSGGRSYSPPSHGSTPSYSGGHSGGGHSSGGGSHGSSGGGSHSSGGGHSGKSK